MICKKLYNKFLPLSPLVYEQPLTSQLDPPKEQSLNFARPKCIYPLLKLYSKLIIKGPIIGTLQHVNKQAGTRKTSGQEQKASSSFAQTKRCAQKSADTLH